MDTVIEWISPMLTQFAETRATYAVGPVVWTDMWSYNGSLGDSGPGQEND